MEQLRLWLYAANPAALEAFYACLFGASPRAAGQEACFDLADPALRLTIKRRPSGAGPARGSTVLWVRRAGFGDGAVERLEAAGLLGGAAACEYLAGGHLLVRDPEGNRLLLVPFPQAAPEAEERAPSLVGRLASLPRRR